MSKKKARTFLDKHLNLQAILVGLAIVMFWRGAWGLMDMYLFAHDSRLSFIASLIIGLVLLFIINHRKLRDLG